MSDEGLAGWYGIAILSTEFVFLLAAAVAEERIQRDFRLTEGDGGLLKLEPRSTVRSF